MKLFEQMKRELLLEYVGVDREMLLEFANYKLSDGGIMGKEASFALWGDSRQDTSFFWKKEIWYKLKPELIIFGMNQSQYIDSNFGIFHKEMAGDTLKEVGEITPSMSGAMIFDLIKLKAEFVQEALKDPKVKRRIDNHKKLDYYTIRAQKDDENGIYLAPNSALVSIIWKSERSGALHEYTKKMYKEKLKIVENVFKLADSPTIIGTLGKFTDDAARTIGIKTTSAAHPSAGYAIGKGTVARSIKTMSSNGIIKRILLSNNMDQDDIKRLGNDIDIDKFYKIKSELEYILDLIIRTDNINRIINSDSRPWPSSPGPERQERIKEKNSLLGNNKKISEEFETAKKRIASEYNIEDIRFTKESVNNMLFNILKFEDEYGDLKYKPLKKEYIDPFASPGY